MRSLELLAPGIILPYAGSAAPTGWLLCFGQAVSRTTYAGLFSAIGTTFGVGDGSTTFNVPDLRGRVAAGEDDMGGTAANRLNVALTGNTTSASNAVTALSSTAGLSVGMQVFGTGISAGTTIASITSATAITLSANATATGTAVALRFGIVDALTLGAVGGSHVHTLTTNQMPSHSHAVNNSASTTIGGAYTTASLNAANGLQPVTVATGGDQAHPNIQPTMILNQIIKT